jgi:chitinase
MPLVLMVSTVCPLSIPLSPLTKTVDWEHPSTPEEGRNFLSLLAAVRLHLHHNRYLLTAALPAGEWTLRNIDLRRAQDYLDFINLMAYDFAGSWSTIAGHQAQLYPGNPGESSGSAATEYVISQGFPPQKILLGIPVYGRSFVGAAGPGQPFTATAGEEGTFEYKNLPREGSEEIVNTRVVGAFCTGGDGGFVSYDNPETVKIKAAYVREKRLGVKSIHNSRNSRWLMRYRDCSTGPVPRTCLRVPGA